MLKLTLDTSCFGVDSKELEELMKICEDGKIIIQLSPITLDEMTRDHPKKLKQYVEYLRLIKEPEIQETKEFEEIANRAISIHSSPTTDERLIQKMTNPDEFVKYTLKHESTFNDVDIFAFHVITKGDFFVTKDERGFIRGGKKELFENKFNTKVRLLDKNFIEELKSNL